MKQVVDRPRAVGVPVFEDGFGFRMLTLDVDSGEAVEELRFNGELAATGGFAPALSDLVSRYASTRHASYLRVRRIDRPAPGALVLVSDRVPGWRLADLLRVSAREGVAPDLSAALNLLRQLVPAVALFSRHQKDLAIGNVAPERLIVTPRGRLVIAEHLLGRAIAALHYSRERYWHDLRVALPPAPLISPRADATGIGLVALSLIVGRTIKPSEFPENVPALLSSATERIDGASRPLGEGLQSWLSRALQVDTRTAFQSPGEAQVAFESVLASDSSYVTASGALDAWIERCAAILGEPTDLATHLAVPEPESAEAIERDVVVVEPPPSIASAESSTEPAAHTGLLTAHAASTSMSADAASDMEPPALLSSSQPPGSGGWPSWLLVALGATIVLEAAAIGWLWTRAPALPLADKGELVVQTRPASARVSIDGEDRGVSPLTVQLAPGTHVLEVHVGRSEPRVIPLTIRAGVQSAQYIELQSVPTTGGIEVRSEARAKVTIDGVSKGTTPLVVRDLPPGDHEVVLETSGGREVRQRVRIEPGVTAQLVVPLSR